ncbi:DNAJ domain-containing protein DNAJB family protein [Schizosaccharomyces cryophilus OY26]|uniref:DNAJ domain-containing protein DNAJB family protein n=1 Tax=Schizosaccharomyces cryophilus (strain OY26 / ATCC MYA-4695 / CBS 11777 / NBRC 106824 / NRRL Y48691) TaxID=653667 RepID=S9XDK0_SCHCR|nr:DNAJ domain-containing protein DNAJB family protein [Schizosaccharomyces cryophilus OY26]EPY51816.1 DNAJ domain-containing protein DNAJB family protein [Schizosaccharomyces cryophilus OY26]
MRCFISQFSPWRKLNWFQRNATTFTPKNLKSLTPYEVMELPRTCTPADIKRKYIELVKVHHPDKSKSGSEATDLKAHDEKNQQEYFRLLVAAKSLLTDKQRRYEYDRFGFHWNQSSPSQPFTKPSANPRYPMYSRARRSSGMGTWEEYYYNSFDFEKNHKEKGDSRKIDDEGMMVFAGILSFLVIFSVYSNYRNSKYYQKARVAAIEQSENDFDYYSTGMSDLSKDDRISRFLILRDQNLKSDPSSSSSTSRLPLHPSSPATSVSSSSERSLPAPASPSS